MSKKLVFIIWVVILFIELLSFYLLNNRPHAMSDAIFMITVISVTMVIGIIGVGIADKK